ncbi:glycoprotein antigen BM86 isoform X3 [Ixodes scapularis]|uniref:glycoprotein antigen BM86 isoform X3 n=1 Tax=Ixodes scapularis TaxID=6945 RepID=UPI001A9EF6D3|nr:glycoprotein antigen BM86 isoform X3 [Ixodes scapularis]
MRSLCLFVWSAHFACCVIVTCSPQTGIMQARENQNHRFQDICTEGSVGYKTCHEMGAFCSPIQAKKTFQCDCWREDLYYDANETMCKHWQSCEPNPCRYGKCTDQGGKKPRSCSCPRMKDLYENCQIKKEKELSCEEAQAIARIDQNGRVYCDCGPAKTYHNGKCELTGCLNYSKTCQDLCNDNILYKDDRCCEGWNASNCSRPPIASTFCPTGYVRLRGQCRDACTANVTSPICPEGCTPMTNDQMPFHCKCKSGFELAEDGLTCREKVVCNEEEKKKCHESEICTIIDTKAVCTCAEGLQRLNGVCTDKCTTKCDHKFAKCVIIDRYERCTCIYPLSKTSNGNQMCTLEFYSYILVFQTNDTEPYTSSFCDNKLPDITSALKVVFGRELLKVETVSCKNEFVLRLVFENKQHPAVLRRMSNCQYPQGDVCIFPPKLNVKAASLKAIEEENLCAGILQELFNVSDASSECTKEEDNYTIRCREGFTAYGEVKSGRLTRWSCKAKDLLTSSSTESNAPETISPEAGSRETTTLNNPEDPCISIPCFNNGLCKKGPKNTYMCECKQGFSGERCERNAGKKLEAQVVAVITFLIGMQLSLRWMFGLA